MAIDIERLLEIISDTELLQHDDQLSQLLDEVLGRRDNDELFESDLELVSAAAKPDYERFIEYLKSRGF